MIDIGLGILVVLVILLTIKFAISMLVHAIIGVLVLVALVFAFVPGARHEIEHVRVSGIHVSHVHLGELTHGAQHHVNRAKHRRAK